jgi:hypothetical protein
MRKIIFTTAILGIISLTSCTDAEKAKMGGYGKTYTVQVLGPDTVITFQSTGKVISENESDGYYFTNAANNKLTEVSGTVIITEN